MDRKTPDPHSALLELNNCDRAQQVERVVEVVGHLAGAANWVMINHA
jgi:hypothetical protein